MTKVVQMVGYKAAEAASIRQELRYGYAGETFVQISRSVIVIKTILGEWGWDCSLTSPVPMSMCNVNVDCLQSLGRLEYQATNYQL